MAGDQEETDDLSDAGAEQAEEEEEEQHEDADDRHNFVDEKSLWLLYLWLVADDFGILRTHVTTTLNEDIGADGNDCATDTSARKPTAKKKDAAQAAAFRERLSRSQDEQAYQAILENHTKCEQEYRKLQREHYYCKDEGEKDLLKTWMDSEKEKLDALTKRLKKFDDAMDDATDSKPQAKSRKRKKSASA